MSESTPDRPESQPLLQGGRALLARALARARWSILWERLWPALATIATAAGLFLALSWLGLWLVLPPLGRALVLVGFFVLAVAAVVPLFLVRVPNALDGLRRLDRASLMPHRPATAIADKIAPETGDPFATALWRSHVERALLAARALKAGPPQPLLAMRDPFALRALVLVLVIASFFVAGSDRTRRLAAAFDWRGVMTPANYRIDAWVTPPAYTGRPPLILTRLAAGRNRARQRPGDGAGRLDPGGARDRRWRSRRGGDRRDRAGRGRCPAAGAQGHRGTPLHHRRVRRRQRARCEREGGLDASTPFPTIRRPSRSPRSPKGKRAARCCWPTSSRMITAWSTRRRPSNARPHRPRRQAGASAVTMRRISRWCCRRRAPAAASAKPPRI